MALVTSVHSGRQQWLLDAPKGCLLFHWAYSQALFGSWVQAGVGGCGGAGGGTWTRCISSTSSGGEHDPASSCCSTASFGGQAHQGIHQAEVQCECGDGRSNKGGMSGTMAVECFLTWCALAHWCIAACLASLQLCGDPHGRMQWQCMLYSMADMGKAGEAQCWRPLQGCDYWLCVGVGHVSQHWHLEAAVLSIVA